MATDSVSQAPARPNEAGIERAARRMNKGVMYRALIHVIGLHVFAAIVLLVVFIAPPHH
jgi:hypothetical protein